MELLLSEAVHVIVIDPYFICDSHEHSRTRVMMKSDNYSRHTL